MVIGTWLLWAWGSHNFRTSSLLMTWSYLVRLLVVRCNLSRGCLMSSAGAPDTISACPKRTFFSLTTLLMGKYLVLVLLLGSKFLITWVRIWGLLSCMVEILKILTGIFWTMYVGGFLGGRLPACLWLAGIPSQIYAHGDPGLRHADYRTPQFSVSSD